MYWEITKGKDNGDVDQEYRIVNEYVEHEEEVNQDKLHKKLRNLWEEEEREEKETRGEPIFPDVPDRYVNLSNYQLSYVQITALNRGFKYAYPVQNMNPRDVITQVEPIVRSTPEGNKELLRIKVLQGVKADYRRKDITEKLKYEKEELMDLRKNQNLAIIKADKSDTIVIMERDEYTKKMNEALEKIPKETLQRDPTNKIIRDLATFKNHSHLPEPIKKACVPPNGASTPMLFGQIKLHKEGQPMRLLVSGQCAPTRIAESALQRYLTPMFGKHKYSISSPTKALESIASLGSDNTLYSLDVIGLFPNTPVDVAINTIEQRLIAEGSHAQAEIQDIRELLEFLTSNAYFQFDKKIIRQTFGAAMGSPLSGLLAEAVMQSIETAVIENFPYKPNLYVRYVDDVLIAWPHGEEKLIALKNAMEEPERTIKFTVEKEEEGRLPYLDINIVWREGRTCTTVYRKPSYTPVIIPKDSYHPNGYKAAAFRALFKRAVTYCSDKRLLGKELREIHRIGKIHGYSYNFVEKIYKTVTNGKKNGKEETKKRFIGSLPYLPATVRAVKKDLDKYQLDIGIKTQSIKDIVLNNKDRKETYRKPGVYQIPVPKSETDKRELIYVGSTKRTMMARLLEHEADIRRKREKTALSKHCKINNVEPLWDKIKMKAVKSQSTIPIRILEAITIEENQGKTINDDTPYQISDTWKALIREFKKNSKPRKLIWQQPRGES